MQETKTVIYSVHNKTEFGSGAMSASGTHSCVCFLAGTLVRSAYKKKKKKMLIAETFCYGAGVWIADKDTIVNEASALRITKGTSDFFLLRLFIAA